MWAADLPGHVEPVRRHVAVEIRAEALPVAVNLIVVAVGAEFLDVEPGVPGAERIDCPNDLDEPALERHHRLELLQLRAKPERTQAWPDGENFREYPRATVHVPTVANANSGWLVLPFEERAEHVPASFGAGDEHTSGEHVDIGQSEALALHRFGRDKL